MDERNESTFQEKDAVTLTETDAGCKERLKEIHTWWEVPAIAHFCSLFKAVFGFSDFDIEDLEDALLTSPALGGSTLAVDIICQLLNGCYARDDIKYFNYDLFLKDIFKQRWVVEEGRTNPFNERTFLELPVRLRVEVLHALCDFRLDADDVAEMLKGLSGDSLRVEPLGVDAKGSKYWYFYGTRLYKELPDQENEKLAKRPRGRPKKSVVKEEQGREELPDGRNAELEEEEEDQEEEGGELTRRNPVLSAKPRQANKEELEEEDADLNFEKEDDGLPDAAEEEEEEEEYEDEVQRELAEALYEDENDAAMDDDEGDADFVVTKKKKSAKTRKKSPTKKASTKDEVVKEVEPTVEPDVAEAPYIENMMKPKRKKQYFRGGKKKSRSRSKSMDKRKSQSVASIGSDSETKTSAEQTKRPRKKKEPAEPTPTRKSRRRGGNESDEDGSTPVIFDSNVSKAELKRLAIDGFHNQLSSVRSSRNTSRESSVASDAAKMEIAVPRHMGHTKTMGHTHGKALQAAVSKLASSTAQERSGGVAVHGILAACSEESTVANTDESASQETPGPSKRGSSRRKSVPQRRQNKEDALLVCGEEPGAMVDTCRVEDQTHSANEADSISVGEEKADGSQTLVVSTLEKSTIVSDSVGGGKDSANDEESPKAVGVNTDDTSEKQVAKRAEYGDENRLSLTGAEKQKDSLNMDIDEAIVLKTEPNPDDKTVESPSGASVGIRTEIQHINEEESAEEEEEGEQEIIDLDDVDFQGEEGAGDGKAVCDDVNLEAGEWRVPPGLAQAQVQAAALAGGDIQADTLPDGNIQAGAVISRDMQAVTPGRDVEADTPVGDMQAGTPGDDMPSDIPHEEMQTPTSAEVQRKSLIATTEKLQTASEVQSKIPASREMPSETPATEKVQLDTMASEEVGTGALATEGVSCNDKPVVEGMVASKDSLDEIAVLCGLKTTAKAKSGKEQVIPSEEKSPAVNIETAMDLSIENKASPISTYDEADEGNISATDQMSDKDSNKEERLEEGQDGLSSTASKPGQDTTDQEKADSRKKKEQSTADTQGMLSTGGEQDVPSPHVEPEPAQCTITESALLEGKSEEKGTASEGEQPNTSAEPMDTDDVILEVPAVQDVQKCRQVEDTTKQIQPGTKSQAPLDMETDSPTTEQTETFEETAQVTSSSVIEKEHVRGRGTDCVSDKSTAGMMTAQEMTGQSEDNSASLSVSVSDNGLVVSETSRQADTEPLSVPTVLMTEANEDKAADKCTIDAFSKPEAESSPSSTTGAEADNYAPSCVVQSAQNLSTWTQNQNSDPAQNSLQEEVIQQTTAAQHDEAAVVQTDAKDLSLQKAEVNQFVNCEAPSSKHHLKEGTTRTDSSPPTIKQKRTSRWDMTPEKRRLLGDQSDSRESKCPSPSTMPRKDGPTVLYISSGPVNHSPLKSKERTENHAQVSARRVLDLSNQEAGEGNEDSKEANQQAVEENEDPNEVYQQAVKENEDPKEANQQEVEENEEQREANQPAVDEKEDQKEANREAFEEKEDQKECNQEAVEGEKGQKGCNQEAVEEREDGKMVEGNESSSQHTFSDSDLLPPVDSVSVIKQGSQEAVQESILPSEPAASDSEPLQATDSMTRIEQGNLPQDESSELSKGREQSESNRVLDLSTSAQQTVSAAEHSDNVFINSSEVAGFENKEEVQTDAVCESETAEKASASSSEMEIQSDPVGNVDESDEVDGIIKNEEDKGEKAKGDIVHCSSNDGTAEPLLPTGQVTVEDETGRSEMASETRTTEEKEPAKEKIETDGTEHKVAGFVSENISSTITQVSEQDMEQSKVTPALEEDGTEINLRVQVREGESLPGKVNVSQSEPEQNCSEMQGLDVASREDKEVENKSMTDKIELLESNCGENVECELPSTHSQVHEHQEPNCTVQSDRILSGLKDTSSQAWQVGQGVNIGSAAIEGSPIPNDLVSEGVEKDQCHESLLPETAMEVDPQPDGQEGHVERSEELQEDTADFVAVGSLIQPCEPVREDLAFTGSRPVEELSAVTSSDILITNGEAEHSVVVNASDITTDDKVESEELPPRAELTESGAVDDQQKERETTEDIEVTGQQGNLKFEVKSEQLGGERDADGGFCAVASTGAEDVIKDSSAHNLQQQITEASVETRTGTGTDYLESRTETKEEEKLKAVKKEIKEGVEHEDISDVKSDVLSSSGGSSGLTDEPSLKQEVKSPVKHVSLYEEGDQQWRSGLSRWQLVCDTVEDWTSLALRLETETQGIAGARGGGKAKALCRIIKSDFLPEMPVIMADKEQAREKRRREMMPRRSSYRLELKKMEEEEKERLSREAEEEEERLRSLAEEERKQQMKLEEEKRLQEEKEKAREERANRVKLREERARLIAEGKEIPPELMNGLKQDDNALDDENEEMYNNIEKVLLTVKKNEHSWPFLEAVEEVNTPDFFDMIKEPMDLITIDRKVAERVYKRKEEFERDMNLVFDNCIEYHGADSDFGYMAENLKGVFERSMRRVFRVYLEPAWRKGDSWPDYVPFRPARGSRKRTNYRENSDSDSESEPHQRGRIMYPSGRKWGEDETYTPTKEEEQEDESDKERDEKEDLKPRATWSYRRDMGQEAKDFESYIPCGTGRRRSRQDTADWASKPEVKPVDLSKYAGAKFRVANHKESKKASLPVMIINQYVKKAKPGEGGGDAPPTKGAVSSGPPVQKAMAPAPAPGPATAGGKPPVKVVKISKAEYERLLAQNKLSVMDANNPAGKVIKLQPGMQIKAMATSATPGTTPPPLLSPSQSVPAKSSTSPMTPASAASTPESQLTASPSLTDESPIPSRTAKESPVPSSFRTTRNRKDESNAEVSPGKKTAQAASIRDRLRMINEKLGHKLKKGSSTHQDDGTIITREETVYADSMVVNGQTILNVSAAKGGSKSADSISSASVADASHKNRTVTHITHKPGKYIQEADLARINKIEQHIARESFHMVSGKRPAEGDDTASDDGSRRESLLSRSHKRARGESFSSPPVKKVRFSDQLEVKGDRDGGEGHEAESRLGSDSAVPESDTSKTPASSRDPSACSSSPSKSSSSSESDLSIYEKWKKRALRSNPVLFSNAKPGQQSEEMERDGEIDASKKRKHQEVSDSQDQHLGHGKDDVIEDEEDEDNDSEDEPMMKYSKKSDVWHERKATGIKSQSGSFDKVIGHESHHNGSMQQENNQDSSSPSQTVDNSATTSKNISNASSSPLVENGGFPNPETTEGEHEQVYRDSFNQALHLQQKTASPPISDRPSLPPEPVSTEGDAPLVPQAAQAHIPQPSASDESTHSDNLSAGSSKPGPSTSTLDRPPPVLSSPSSPPPPQLLSPSPSSSQSSSSAPCAASQKKTFTLSGLSSQLALAMAHKRQQGSSSNTEGEECGDGPPALSPPLLLPVGQEEPDREGSRDASPCDEDMPVLVPDQLPPTLVEPGQDNIFQRMMSPPEKHKA